MDFVQLPEPDCLSWRHQFFTPGIITWARLLDSMSIAYFVTLSFINFKGISTSVDSVVLLNYKNTNMRQQLVCFDASDILFLHYLYEWILTTFYQEFHCSGSHLRLKNFGNSLPTSFSKTVLFRPLDRNRSCCFSEAFRNIMGRNERNSSNQWRWFFQLWLLIYIYDQPSWLT